jgi:hypothetical protein
VSAFADAIGGYETVVSEEFDGSELDRTRWLPFYLPQWAGRDRSRARYRLTGRQLELFIADDQPVWCPAAVPGMRVSSVQTGCFSGPTGSTVGQHRTDERMTVVEAQPTERLLTPLYGAIEMRARWRPHRGHMVALWMIGFEDRPERSAEICICEIFGAEAAPDRASVGVGLHPFGDPAIVDDFEKVAVSIDVSELHDYAAVWTATDVTFFVDGEVIKRSEQAPQYPMQLMLNIYDFGTGTGLLQAHPFIVDRIRVSEAIRRP